VDKLAIPSVASAIKPRSKSTYRRLLYRFFFFINTDMPSDIKVCFAHVTLALCCLPPGSKKCQTAILSINLVFQYHARENDMVKNYTGPGCTHCLISRIKNLLYSWYHCQVVGRAVCNLAGSIHNKWYLCGTIPLSHIHIIFTVYIVYKPPREWVQWLWLLQWLPGSKSRGIQSLLCSLGPAFSC